MKRSGKEKARFDCAWWLVPKTQVLFFSALRQSDFQLSQADVCNKDDPLVINISAYLQVLRALIMHKFSLSFFGLIYWPIIQH